MNYQVVGNFTECVFLKLLRIVNKARRYGVDGGVVLLESSSTDSLVSKLDAMLLSLPEYPNANEAGWDAVGLHPTEVS